MYAIVNDSKRKNFEEKYQMPYGYANCYIFRKYNEALKYLEEAINKSDCDWIIEEYDKGVRTEMMRVQ